MSDANSQESSVQKDNLLNPPIQGVHGTMHQDPSKRLQGNNPVPSAPPETNIGSYLVREEIARGGMGVIVRYADSHLRREVAIKMLLPEYRQNPMYKQLFWEEAQITAQLQHPGIPPIHELGTLEDKSPYLVMKLIKGKTLASMLDDRLDAKQERSKYLAIFEQICQTLAYAHSRQVIHRDLKPSNVMVGAFGEVQVMDWGLAKVLNEPTTQEDTTDPILASHIRDPRSDDQGLQTRAGSLKGTPAFMPPEQAAGIIDMIDYRADVFGLGAILCVILTGQPPYVGKSFDHVKLMALRGKLEDAFARLDNCEAEPELIALCKRCLAPDAEDRLSNAGEVAKAICDLRLRAEERARQAELDQVRAVAEQEKIQQRERSKGQIENILGQIAEMQRQGSWKNAMLLVEQADQMLGTDGDEALRERVALARKNLDFLGRMDQIRQEKAIVVQGAWNPGQANPKYEQTFRDFGLDLFNMDAVQIFGQLQSSIIRNELIAAIDDWALDETPPRSQHLSRIADEVTGSSWRQEIANKRTDASALRQLVQRVLQQGGAPAVYIRLARELANSAAEATTLLEEGSRRHLKDFWLHFTRGNHHRKNGNAALAIAAFQACLVLQPENIAAWNNLGLAFQDKGELDNAIACFKKALELDPGFLPANYNLAIILQATGNVQEAINYIKKATDTDLKDANALHNFALDLQRKGDLDGATNYYKKAIQANPNFMLSHYNLGLVLQDKGDLEGAVASYRRAIEIEPTDVFSHYNLGMVLKRMGDIQGALASYNKAIELDPKYANAYNSLGIVQQDLGQFEDAIESYYKAMELDPAFAFPHYNLARVRTTQGDMDAAIACYQKAIELEPTYAPSYYNVGVIHHDRREFDKAIACYEKVIELDPRYISAYVELGNAMTDKGDLRRAIIWYKRAIEIDPKYTNAYNNLGIALHDLGEMQEAISCYQKAIQLNPKFANPYYNLGRIFKQIGDLDKAIQLHKQAIDLDPNYAAFHYSLGLLYQSKADLHAAVNCFQAAIRVNPKYLNAYIELGNTLSDLGNMDDSIASYQKAIELNPNYSTAYNNLGIVQQAKGDLQAAIQSYEQAIDLEPDFAFPYYNLGRVYKQMGNRAEAIRYYKKSIELDPKFANAYKTLGTLLQEEGDFQGAMAYFKKAIELNPKFLQAETFLGSNSSSVQDTKNT